ncbi:MAG: N-acetyl-gamma-glutamyl-phosphate reductase [Ignavibacteriae bacterium HGW-Ignavibacteriae-2]|jgi:N-acetyl-gamma-glutamyl-phosphate reductase|nr:N-acetyl-gamma-glutamyl-phosphate reductase [Bacteroidota bacterium]PKL87070.1 MAG: N-acetyl-gamma-glutamyl-phosphate reductase [Ignavibacteriae bacterium HGW-Ignavibacteriae-2]
MISVGIIGGTGYTGKYLVQFCSGHPFVEEMYIYANGTSGQTMHQVFPEFEGVYSNSVIKSIENLSYEHDMYFVALPHGKALDVVPILLQKGKSVIDLSGDFRLDDESQYIKWYDYKHTSADLLSKKHYGLADVCSSESSTFVSNPGCYPTAALLSLLPLTGKYNYLINDINISAYSGASGAGKSLKQHLLLSELHDNVQAYNVCTHRHQPEIYQEIVKSGFSGSFNFVTHLLPISTGIYSTAIVNLSEKIEPSVIHQLYKEFYENKHFVRLRSVPPQLKWTVGTNYCDLNVVAQERTIVITSVIDNLIKGASGQAVQNMNQMFGWDEWLGIVNNYEFQKESISLI